MCISTRLSFRARRLVGNTLTKSLRTTSRPARLLTALSPSCFPCSLVQYSTAGTASFRPALITPVAFVEDTIYAVSTASGRAGIAIVRISGPLCLDVYRSLCPLKAVPTPRYASIRTLYDPVEPAEVLDSEALVLYFPNPKTVTGEDVLELHIHGGTATVKAVLAAIPKCATKHVIRYAEPGEFTRRAFQNDRLDLAQVEALSDTLSAETEQQRRAAVRGASRKLGQTYEGWRQQLLYARGELEALIDFSEDQHFDESPADLLASITAQVQVMVNSISAHREAGQRGELLKKGIRIALLGPPNAGKSSLLNQLVGREASIVSREAGTTRDIVEVSLDIQGYLCTFADTAGLRTAPKLSMSSEIGEVELEGIKRAKKKAAAADVVIVLTHLKKTRNNFEIIWDENALEIAAQAPHSLLVLNKVDRELAISTADLTNSLQSIGKFQDILDVPKDSHRNILQISCRDAEQYISDPRLGIPGDFGHIKSLVTQLVSIFRTMTDLPKDMEDLLGVTQRQSQLLLSCSEDLKLFMAEAQKPGGGEETDIVLAAEHLRSAANCVSRITGRGEAGDVEEVLGVVFEK